MTNAAVDQAPEDSATGLFKRLVVFAHIVISVYYLYLLIGAAIAGLAFIARKAEGTFISTYPHITTYYPLNIYETVIAALLIVISALAFRYNIYRKRWRKIAGLCDDFSLQYARMRQATTDSLLDAGPDREISSDKYVALLYEFDRFLEQSVVSLHKIFMAYTGRHCHVSIKTYNGKNNLVTHAIRDRMAPDKDRRQAIDEHQPSFHYKQNTAFKAILDDTSVAVYVNNRLYTSYLFGRYENKHEKWYRLYRSTAVVPVTMHTHEHEINKDNVWGFLCVDNKGGHFDKGVCTDMMFAFARIYYIVFNLMGKVQNRDANINNLVGGLAYVTAQTPGGVDR